jgi:hypothetical protein
MNCDVHGVLALAKSSPHAPGNSHIHWLAYSWIAKSYLLVCEYGVPGAIARFFTVSRISQYVLRTLVPVFDQ